LSTGALNNPANAEIPSPGFLDYQIPSLSPGTYAVTITDNNGCINSTQQTVGITNPSPIIAGNQTICAGSTSQLRITNSQPAASLNAWVSSNTAVAQIDNLGLVTAISAGTTTITYTSSTGCVGTYSITVNASPTFNLSTPPNICTGTTTALTATSSPSSEIYNYQWSTTPVTNQNGVSSSSITVSPSSTTTYTATATNPTTNCVTSKNILLTVNPITQPLFTQLGPYCKNATPGTLPLTSNNGIAGTWAPSTISTSSVGSVVYTFTPSSTAYPTCASGTTMTVTIADLPTATISGSTTVCQNATQPSITFTGATEIGRAHV
jgi:hypothetical protein